MLLRNAILLLGVLLQFFSLLFRFVTGGERRYETKATLSNLFFQAFGRRRQKFWRGPVQEQAKKFKKFFRMFVFWLATRMLLSPSDEHEQKRCRNSRKGLSLHDCYFLLHFIFVKKTKMQKSLFFSLFCKKQIWKISGSRSLTCGFLHYSTIPTTHRMCAPVQAGPLPLAKDEARFVHSELRGSGVRRNEQKKEEPESQSWRWTDREEEGKKSKARG